MSSNRKLQVVIQMLDDYTNGGTQKKQTSKIVRFLYLELLNMRSMGFTWPNIVDELNNNDIGFHITNEKLASYIYRIRKEEKFIESNDLLSACFGDEHLVHRCIESGVTVEMIKNWGYSNAAKLSTQVTIVKMGLRRAEAAKLAQVRATETC
ncbi:MAG: hypothetical protein ACRC6D_00650 [Aeromonas sp.]